MNHAITVGDFVLSVAISAAVALAIAGAIGLSNYLRYRRAIKAMQNRPYDPQEG